MDKSILLKIDYPPYNMYIKSCVSPQPSDLGTVKGGLS